MFNRSLSLYTIQLCWTQGGDNIEFVGLTVFLIFWAMNCVKISKNSELRISETYHSFTMADSNKWMSFALSESKHQWSIGKSFHWIQPIFIINRTNRMNILLCKRPGCYHRAKKAQITKRIFKLIPIHASVIYRIPWNHWIHWISVPFRENIAGDACCHREVVWTRITYSCRSVWIDP